MMTGFSSHFGPEEEYVLASFATGLRTFLEVTDDSIIRGCPAKPCQKLCLLSLLTVLSQPIPYLTRFDWPDLSICYHICDFYIVCAAYSRNHARYQLCALESIFFFPRSSDQSVNPGTCGDLSTRQVGRRHILGSTTGTHLEYASG